MMPSASPGDGRRRVPGSRRRRRVDVGEEHHVEQRVGDASVPAGDGLLDVTDLAGDQDQVVAGLDRAGGDARPPEPA